ncbi:MAG: six-hairpin glycosidase [Candidatus Cryptobacteroides sp.]
MKPIIPALLLAAFLWTVECTARNTIIPVPQMKTEYPRMVVGQDSPEQITAQTKACRNRADRYIQRHTTDPEWIVSRLQMYWHSHADEIYIKGEKLDHVAGHAPVPTVRYTATRGTQTIYSRPSLEDTPPYQDSLGMWMLNKTTGQMEWADPRETGRNVESMNITIMKLARDAAYLWWAEGDEDCAKFAADIFDTYMTGLYYREMPVDIAHTHQQTLVGLTSFEVIHEDIALPAAECYDFIHDYLVRTKPEKIAVYDEAFRKWADVIIANGVPHNNWNLIQARFVLNIAMILPDNEAFEDGRGRNWYINEVLNENSIRQWSIGRLIDYGFDSNTGLWKESPSYSIMVIGEFDAFADLLYRTTGEDLVEYYPILNKAPKVLPQYLLPNGISVCWGDGHTAKPKYSFKHLEAVSADRYADYQTPVFWSEGVSWFASRIGSDPQNSLMMSVIGSQGNHVHSNGIAMELYGKGYDMAPDLGRGSGYTTPDYLEFYSQFPAHNTVCVDGVSSYPAMESHHPYKLTDCYPQPSDGTDGEAVILDDGMSFGEFAFVEPETMSDQLRQLIMVNTRSGAGYYVDIFRSRRQDGKDKFHDYFYHNIGQEFTLNVDQKPTEELAFAGACLYAYSYLWDKYEARTAEDVEGKFVMTCDDGSKAGMRMWMQGAQDRIIFKALSPVIDALTRIPMPYDLKNSPCQTFVARQDGEAWTRPFVAVYQPFADGDKLEIEKVEYFGDGYAGVKVIFSDGGVDYIFSSDIPKKMKYDGISVNGTLCVISCGEVMTSRGTTCRLGKDVSTTPLRGSARHDK